MHFSNFLSSLSVFLFMGMHGIMAQQPQLRQMTLLPQEIQQEVVGFGASLAYYEGWLNAHPNKQEIYQAIFGELSLDILRVRNAYEYDPQMVDRVKEYMEAAELALGYPIALFSTSWGPPGYLKNTGDRKNGGSLRYTLEGGSVKFDYEGFAHWWNRSLDEYQAHGISPDYITIQNEPNWTASWETCLFNPVETINTRDTIAGYDRALNAVYDSLLTREARPLILGPETVGIGYNNVQNYVNALDLSKLDGISHHLYHGVDENNPYASTEFSKLGDFHPEIPHFQTEFSRGDWFSLAGLIYKSFYDEQVAAYLYWDLIWNEGGLVQLDNPWDRGQWMDPAKGYTRTKDFYAFKQFSAFVHPGWKMIRHSFSGENAASLTFLSPGGDSATAVLINRSALDPLKVHVNVPGYHIHQSAIYSTSETENCEFKGVLLDSVLTLQPRSISTIDMRLSAYDPSEDLEAPTIPGGLMVIDSSLTSLSLGWTPSTDNIGVNAYRIYVNGLLYASSKDTLYEVTGLDHSTTYEIRISAYDHAMNESDQSAPVLGSTLEGDGEAPTVPTGLRIFEIKKRSIVLHWDASGDNKEVQGYHVFLDHSLIDSTSELSYEFDQLDWDIHYEMTVSAFDEAGNVSDKAESIVGIIHYFDTKAPILNVSSSIYQEGFIVLVSSEKGVVYLVPENTQRDLDSIQKFVLDSLEVEARRGANMFISGLDNGAYWMFASDSAQNISEPEVVTVLGVGMETYNIHGLEVFPNPMSKSAILKFSLETTQKMWMTLMDSQGRMVQKQYLGILSAGLQQVVFHRESLSKGLYFFKLDNNNGEGLSGPLMIGD